MCELILENTSGRITHPEHVAVGRVLISDPLADPIQKGEPGLGWEGDPRLALYLNVRDREWELWRLEADEQYRRALHCDARVNRGFEAVPKLILELVGIDQRRGHNALEVVERKNAKREADGDQKFAETIEQAGDKMAHAFKRDSVHVI